MKSSQFLEEGFVEDAHNVHQDHEVQMAREELYHSAESALRLHKLLRNVSEEHGLEGWVSAKITLANDYLKTVLEYMEYHLMTDASGEGDVAVEPEAEIMTVAEGSGPKEKQKTPYRDINSPEYRAAADKQKQQMAKDKAAEPGKKLADKIAKKGVAEAGNKSLEPHIGMGDSRTPRELKTQMRGASDEFVRSTADKKTGPFHSKVAKMQNKLAKSELRRRQQGVAEAVDAGEYDARKTTPSSKEKNDEVFRKHRERMKALDKDKKGVAEDTSAGNVATVNNPTPKNKAKTGTLFGGTYQQPKAKAKK